LNLGGTDADAVAWGDTAGWPAAGAGVAGLGVQHAPVVEVAGAVGLACDGAGVGVGFAGVAGLVWGGTGLAAGAG